MAKRKRPVGETIGAILVAEARPIPDAGPR